MSEPANRPPSDSNPPALPSSNPVPNKVIPAEQLFQGQREICIDLDGIQYRLRITRRNKLILQK